MAQLIVRKLEEALVRALKMQAARNGRSAEAEHRELLKRALDPDEIRPPLRDLLLDMPDVGGDADFKRPRDRGRDVEL